MPVPSTAQPIELADGIYWVGDDEQSSKLNCNPYLIIDGHEGVLIDPGSPLDFAVVRRKVEQLIPLTGLRYIVLQHQDPDFCSSTPLFEQQGFCGQLATHWRAAQLIRFYGVTSPFYIVNEKDLNLTFGNGRTLHFHLTPYLHFPGAIVTYDSVSKILFSSDLFGAFSDHAPLFADEWPEERNYMDAMASFHEHYMPSNSILRPVMEQLNQLDIRMIAPQHGSIIRRDVKQHIATLRELECGSFVTPLRQELPSFGGYTLLLNKILKRLFIAYPKQTILSFYQDSSITLDPANGTLADFCCSGEELWQLFFEILHKQSADALTYLEPLVRKLALEYGIEMPQIYDSLLLSLQQSALRLTQENERLQQENQRLTQELVQASTELLHCPLTGLSNERVFQRYLEKACRSYQVGGFGAALLLIGIDNMAGFNLRYGNAAGDEALRIIAGLLEETVPDSHLLFKLNGPIFACVLSSDSKEAALRQGEAFRNKIALSERLLERQTVSIGLASFSDFSHDIDALPERLASTMYASVKSRLNEARRRGGNQLCSSAELDAAPPLGKILLVDTDEFHLEVMASQLRINRYLVLTATDGEQALTIFERESPELVICAIMLPKMDAFALWEKIQLYSDSRNLTFILTSFQKTEESCLRALALGIEHYFQKPYLLPELLALVELKFRQRLARLAL